MTCKSFKVKGVLIQLLSQKFGWDFFITWISNHFITFHYTISIPFSWNLFSFISMKKIITFTPPKHESSKNGSIRSKEYGQTQSCRCVERIPLLATAAAASTTFLQHSWISKLACRSCRIPAEHKNCSFHYYTTENQIVGTSEIPTEMQMWLFLHMWSFWPFLFTGMLCMTYIVIFCEMETLK